MRQAWCDGTTRALPASGVRVHRVATAALGVGLLVVALLSTVSAGRGAARRDLDDALVAEGVANASALNEYFERAQAIDLLLAHDAVFQQFDPARRLRAGPRAGAAMAQASDALNYLEQLYPGRISEGCLIDTGGSELARVVRGQVAPPAALSRDETRNPFFAPTMRLRPGQVYQSAPYLSPDTDEWVISNSTPLFSASGRPWGLVHFEVALDTFRPGTAGAGGDRPGVSVAVVDVVTGRVVMASGEPGWGTNPVRRAPPAVEALVRTVTAKASATVGGLRVAVALVPHQPHNANSWAVVVSASPRALGWFRSVGLAQVAMALAALLLLLFAGLNLRASTRELRVASLTDELTGLPNRRRLINGLDQELLLAARRQTTCAVLLIDLDRFKEVNDTLGHHHGDQLLRGVAGRLRVAFRDGDTVTRLGGDEFAVVLPDVGDEAAARLLAARCLTRLHEPFLVEGVKISVEASMGLAFAPMHGSDGHALLRAADVAMYKAKERRCGVAVYEAGFDVNTPARLALVGDLRTALQDGELFMHYQPKVDLADGHVHGVEALVRWQHPQLGPVRPSEFVGTAEGSGLILPLTLAALDMAIGQARAWSGREQPLQVAVNLSPWCLLAPDFPALVHALLDRHGLPARLLRLEITESSIMADPVRATVVLTELQQAGIALSIDDFGTGYSSMSYLKHLPVDELKIDQSFVQDMLEDGGDHVLVRSAIDLAHDLGLSVVAEGIRDQSTLEALYALGCDAGQGYHLARPMDAAALTAWLDGRADDRRPSRFAPV